jgi:hypothetical protein
VASIIDVAYTPLNHVDVNEAIDISCTDAGANIRGSDYSYGNLQ